MLILFLFLQLLRAAGYDASAMANAQQAAAAAARIATQNAAAQILQQTAAQAQRQSSTASTQDRTFPGKLTQIKEFPIERSQQPPYKLQKALILVEIFTSIDKCIMDVLPICPLLFRCEASLWVGVSVVSVV